MQRLGFQAILGIFVLLLNFTVSAQTPPPALTIRVQPYLSGLTSPVLLTNAKDGTKRNFIVQQGGIIKVVQPGSTAATDFMNITTRIISGGERGLLGLAFHPQFASNGYFFVYYTRTGDGATVVSRFKTTDSTNALGDPNSERILLTIAQPFSNHNGGMIEFGPDGNLYIGTGDGGSANDPGNRAQNITLLLGKMLRITPDVSGNNANPAYTNPPDNPFVGINGADEIYALGLRNPWRWSFDRGGTNQLWAADVGQGAIEEVDVITIGGNYGWRVYEGTQCTNLDPGLCNPANFTPPVFQYARTGGRCSITGGYVYRGGLRTLPNGAYIYGDYCSGEILMWNNNQQTLLIDTTRLISSFGEDEDGEIYVVGLTTGTIEKLVRAKANADFEGDARTDISVFRPSTGVWYFLNSSNNVVRGQAFGQNGDIPAPEDFDGDNITDIGVFRPSNGTWYYLRSSNNTFAGVQFGQNGDVPVAGDYDGDGRADVSVYRPSNGIWYRLNSGNEQFAFVAWGAGGDIPVPGDFDGDGKYDFNVFRPSNGTWYRRNSINGALSGVQFGQNGDVPVTGDFDGDGKNDQAVYRGGVWYILRSTNSTVLATSFGAASDIPVVGDYDGDGREDIAVFRPESGAWYVLRSSNNTSFGAVFGANGDLPVPAYDMP